jgi:hypothetical protein
VRDFVDYDSNLLAVMAGVASTERAERILARIDAGSCSHTGRGTWVSERYYGPHDCNGGNTGDSAISMGRIAWMDMHARRAVGTPEQAAVAERVLLAPLQEDLLANTWLYERYQCGGGPTHNPLYFEYPTVVQLMLFEGKYGIDIGLTKVEVAPFFAPTDRAWAYDAGLIFVGYNRTDVSGFDTFFTRLPMAGSRRFTVHGVAAGAYALALSCPSPSLTNVTVGAGPLEFAATTGPDCTVRVTRW